MATDPQLVPSPLAAHGEVFTRRWVVDVLLDLAGYTTDQPLVERRLVEPSCGSGAFLRPAVERLLASCGADEVKLDRLLPAISAWDIQPANIARCQAGVTRLLVERGLALAEAEHLASRWVRCGDYLLDEHDDRGVADVVVGNPPYVRLEDVPAERQRRYRSHWVRWAAELTSSLASSRRDCAPSPQAAGWPSSVPTAGCGTSTA